MQNYLVDSSTLGKFVDLLIAQKYPDQPAENFSELKTNAIKALDDRISANIFGGLDAAELTELNQILDTGEENPDVFRNFFRNTNLDLEQKITDTLMTFKNEFLGVQNA